MSVGSRVATAERGPATSLGRKVRHAVPKDAAVRLGRPERLAHEPSLETRTGIVGWVDRGGAHD